jgi:hypothetical protein
MFTKVINITVFCLILFSFLIIQSCNKKEEQTKKSSDNSDLIKTDEKGQKIDLKIKPKTGEIFRYKMVKSSKESAVNKDKKEETLSQEQTETYYYTQEVTEISDAGVVTLKMKYDSINIVVKYSEKDTSIIQTYNSNIKDSIYSKHDFLIYNNMIGSSFKIRVGSNDEFIEAYELEAIYDKLFKELGDTLTPQTKDMVRENLKSSLKDVLVGQFQEFPKNEVYKDSTWSVTKTSDNPPFRYKNIVNYKIKDIKTENNSLIVSVEGILNIEFIDKEYKTKEGSMKISDIDAGGQGLLQFNLSKGCLVKKETNQSIKMTANISSKGKALNTIRETSLSLKIDLL